MPESWCSRLREGGCVVNLSPVFHYKFVKRCWIFSLRDRRCGWSVVSVAMTTFWIGWFVTGQLQKQAQQQSNGKETAKADLPPSHPASKDRSPGTPVRRRMTAK